MPCAEPAPTERSLVRYIWGFDSPTSHKSTVNSNFKQMECNGHKNHATWLLHVWEVIPVLAMEAKYQSEQDDWLGLTPEWCQETFCHWYAERIFNEDGVIADLLNSIIEDIDWPAIKESVDEEIKES